jgi:4-amino-4-deoxy-L-arabinose transferase-like glycosyltransferase
MRKFLKEWSPVIALMLLAGAARFYALGAWPPGLYHDEAFNGLDALRVIGGERPLYFAANHGREPLFIYLVASSVDWLGRSVYALRLPSAVLGLLLIPAAYWMAHQLFDRRVGLLAAALVAVTLWPLHLSLSGFRAGALPLFIALSIGAGVKAYRSGRALHWIIAGIFYGLSFYTYLASRFTPLVLVIMLALVIVLRRWRPWRALLIFGVTTLMVLAPLIFAALTQWDVVMGRPGDISILNPTIHQGDIPGTLIRNTASAAGMFFWRGDDITRHNVPFRPVFDALVVAFFALGLIRLIVAALGPTPPPTGPLLDFLRPGPDMPAPPARVTPIGKLSSLFVLIWIGVLLLPTILAEDTPHFLRAVGVLPVVFVIPAVGLNTAAQWIASRFWRRPRLGYALGSLLAIGVIAISAAFTARDYERYATDPVTAYAFEEAGVQLARQVRAEALAGRRVYVDERFERDWPSLPFLVGGAYTIVPAGETPAWDGVTPATFFVWPYEDWTSMITAPTPRGDRALTVKVTAGPLAQGDLDPQPHTGYLAVQAEPRDGGLPLVGVLSSAGIPPLAGSDTQPEADFENGLRLLGHSVEAVDRDRWRLRTLWQTDRPLSSNETFFVHLLNVDQLVGVYDGDSGGGFYPLDKWKPGDVVVDERLIEIGEVPPADRAQLLLEVGVYDRTTNQRVPVSSATPPVIDQAVWLGGPSDSGPNAIGP